MVSQHCSVRMPQMTSSRMPVAVSSCARLVVVNALCAVLYRVGSPASGLSPSISRTWPLAALSLEPQAVFHKPRHSALIGCGLPAWLIEHGIQRLIISGIRTEQCCETTTRHASDSGYQVDFVSEATLTFAMTDRAGRRWSAEEIKARTELVLDGRFARLLSVQQVLSAADEARAA